MTVKNHRHLIIIVAITFITILFGYVLISGTSEKGKTTTEIPSGNITSGHDDTNLSMSQVLVDIKEEIHRIDPSIFVTEWELNSTNNVVTLYAIYISNESGIKELQGKKTGNFTIFIVHDTEFEKNMADVQQQLIQLRKNPDYHIAATPMILDTFNDPPQNYIELLVDEITPENRKLNNTEIKGWKIFVRTLSPPPTPPTLKTNSSP
jgi:hypothetical protein